MPKTESIVINTSPLIALVAALGRFNFLYMNECIEKMLNHNILLSQTVIHFAIKQAGE